MFSLLAKIFIKDRKNFGDPVVRQKYGTLAGITGFVLNVLLFGGKFVAGVLCGSISMTADAFNNLGDAASSVVTFIGFKLAAKPTDREHPFGHGRMEYVSGLAVSVLILTVGLELVKSSISGIITPVAPQFSYVAAGVLIASVVVKLYMFYYNKSTAKKINSAAMEAVALDSITDCVATGAVLLSLVAYKLFGWKIDAVCGLIVALFILFNGFRSAKETIGLLLGKVPEKELTERIYQTVVAHSEIIGVHDLMVHDYGPGRRFISLHAEVDSKSDIMLAHDKIDNVERELEQKFGCIAVIHMDPLLIGDEKTDRLKALVVQIVSDIDDGCSVHDFRIVDGKTHTNLIFDVLIPQTYKGSAAELKSMIKAKVKEVSPDYHVVCQIEKSFVE